MPLLLLNKPFQVLTRFTSDDVASNKKRATLADYISAPGFYAAGRLDYDSEGLLLLTDHGSLQAQLSNPKWKVAKTYLVQVENTPDASALQQLRQGIMLNDGMTLPAEAELIDEPDWLWPRTPPIRFRKNIATAWIKLSIKEGRNRQVRRMTAAVGHPTLRLIRWSLGPWSLEGLQPGSWRVASQDELQEFMRIVHLRTGAATPTYNPRKKSPINGRN
ncbi:MAG: pseudouridine synthase [Steroidobacteraceae bacterium]